MKTKTKITILIIIGAFIALSFGLVYLIKSLNDQLVQSVNAIDEDMQNVEFIKNKTYNDLLDKLIDHREYDDLAYEITQVSGDLYDYIEAIKSNFIDETGELKTSGELNNTLFFLDTIKTEKGIEFVLKINTYTSTLNSLLEAEFPDTVTDINKWFTTSKIENKDWLLYHYKGMSTTVTLTKLTQLQGDIQTIKLQVVQEMIRRIEYTY